MIYKKGTPVGTCGHNKVKVGGIFETVKAEFPIVILCVDCTKVYEETKAAPLLKGIIFLGRDVETKDPKAARS